MPLSVEKMKLNKDKKTLTVNKSLMLGDVTLEVRKYRHRQIAARGVRLRKWGGSEGPRL